MDINIPTVEQIIDYLSDRLRSDEPTQITDRLQSQDVLTILDSWLRDSNKSAESQLTVLLGVFRILTPVLSRWDNARVNKDFVDTYRVNLRYALPRLIQALQDFNRKF